MTDGFQTLSFAARPRVLLRFMGHAGLILAVLQLPPTAFALFAGEYILGLTELAISVALVAVCVPLARLPAPEQTLTGEALVSVTLTFVFASLLLSVPLMVAGLEPVEAVFEAVSAVTTTGLTTLNSVESLSDSVLFLRSWGQWYGGLGIAVFTLALLTEHPTMARRLIDTDSMSGKPVTTMREYARRIVTTYAGLTIAGLFLMIVVTAEAMPAIIHVLSGISTGGFSSFDASAGGFPSAAPRIAIALLSLCGAVPLALYTELRRGRFRRFLGDAEFLALVGAVVIVWLLLTADMYGAGANLVDAGTGASFLAVSAQTTTGFSTEAVSSLSSFSKLVLIVSMFAGGGLGSTAGGVKLLRLLLCLRLMQLMLRRLRAPAHAVLECRLSGHRYDERDLVGAMMYVILFVAVILISWLAFLAADVDPLDSLFEVVSAVGTVGLSTGMTPTLPLYLKLVLVIDMLAGRVEVLALLAVLHPRLWFGRRMA